MNTDCYHLPSWMTPRCDDAQFFLMQISLAVLAIATVPSRKTGAIAQTANIAKLSLFWTSATGSVS